MADFKTRNLGDHREEVGHRLGLGVAGRGQACEQGRVASSRLPSSGTWGLSAPGGLRAARPACSRSACTPGSLSLRPDPRSRRPPALSAQHSLTRPARGRRREVGACTSEAPARPAEPQEGGEQQEAAGPGPPHPAAPSPGPAPSSTCAARPPPARPRAWRRGGAPCGPTGRGTSATCSCCAGSEGARLGPPRPGRRQTGPRVGVPFPCWQIWSLLCLSRGGAGPAV